MQLESSNQGCAGQELPFWIPDLKEGYCIPTKDQIQALRIEAFSLIGLYVAVMGFELHNVI